MTDRSITLWCPEFQGVNGGIQQFSRLLAEALPRCRSVRATDIAAYPARGAFRRGRFLLRALAGLGLRRPSVVLCTHLHLARLSPLLEALSIRYWICLHGIECWDTEDPRDLRALHGADRLLCVSRHTRQRMVLRFPALESRTRILPDHADDPPQPRPERSTARAALGLPREGPLLLIVSRLAATETYKGHRRLFQALARGGSQGPGLIVAGDGDDLPALHEEAKQLGLSGRVFFTGRLDDQQLECAYAAADGFVLPSTGEGFGIVFLEALLRGVPALGGTRDAAPDPLQDGTTGILVDPEDPDALARGLDELLRRGWDRDELARMTRARFGAHLLPDRLDTLLEES